MSAPAVSILMPVRDAAATLPAALASIRRQTRADWELVAIDDRSRDGSTEILCAAARADARMHCIAAAGDGLVAALNQGLAACRAPIVARMDADDWMHRDRLRQQLALLQQRIELDLVGCHVREFGAGRLAAGRRAYSAWLNSLRSEAELRRDALIECPLPHPTWCARRASLERLGWRDAGWAEDHDLLLRLLAGGGRIDVVPRRLLAWRDRPDRTSRVDPRYALARFTELRAEFLCAGFLAATEQYLLWGHGPTGRALARALRRRGRVPKVIVELHPRRIGQRIGGAEVVAVDRIADLPPLPLVAAVAGPEARAKIRAALHRIGRVELRDFVCAA
jgi:glycosyltransferase involved in cell wall biosynthesis